MRRYAILALVTLSGAGFVPSVKAKEAVAPNIEQHLNKAPVEFTMSEAKRERMMIIQENMDRQRYYERRRYGDGYGYGRRHGGPPPWAPAHGYRRHEYDRW